MIVKDSHHNHAPTLAGSHPVHRKIAMTDDVQNTVAVHTRNNLSTKQILSAIRIDTNKEAPLFKSRDIYNQRAALRPAGRVVEG